MGYFHKWPPNYTLIFKLASPRFFVSHILFCCHANVPSSEQCHNFHPRDEKLPEEIQRPQHCRGDLRGSSISEIQKGQQRKPTSPASRDHRLHKENCSGILCFKCHALLEGFLFPWILIILAQGIFYLNLQFESVRSDISWVLNFDWIHWWFYSWMYFSFLGSIEFHCKWKW